MVFKGDRYKGQRQCRSLCGHLTCSYHQTPLFLSFCLSCLYRHCRRKGVRHGVVLENLEGKNWAMTGTWSFTDPHYTNVLTVLVCTAHRHLCQTYCYSLCIVTNKNLHYFSKVFYRKCERTGNTHSRRHPSTHALTHARTHRVNFQRLQICMLCRPVQQLFYTLSKKKSYFV